MLRDELAHLPDVERRRIVMPQGITMRIGRLEKPEPWPPALLDAIRSTMPLDLMQQYPNYPAFYDRLAARVGVPENRIVVGAGIEEFIRILMCGCFGQRMAVLWPTCAMVDVYARAFNVDLWRIVTDPYNPPSINDIICRIPFENCGLVMLANPGQPVETCYSVGELRELAFFCQALGVTLAIDEAYHGFGAPSALPLVDEFENVVVLRTFSKAYGAAGLRVGFAVAGARAKRAIDAVRQSGEVSSLSMHVATVLMDRYDEFVRPGIDEICASRDWLLGKLHEVGFRAWGSHANHVLVDMGSAQRLQDTVTKLAAEGIYPRATSVAPLESCLLITCGSRDLMQRFYARLMA